MDRVTYGLRPVDSELIKNVEADLIWYESIEQVEALHLDNLRYIRRRLSAASALLSAEIGRVEYLWRSMTYRLEAAEASIMKSMKKNDPKVTNGECSAEAKISLYDKYEERAIYKGAAETLGRLFKSINNSLYALGSDIRRIEAELDYQKYIDDLPNRKNLRDEEVYHRP